MGISEKLRKAGVSEFRSGKWWKMGIAVNGGIICQQLKK